MSELQRRPNEYDLHLPPPAPRLPGDDASVEFLGEPVVRDQLQEVQDQISDHYRELEAGGTEVEEVFRGTTGGGIMVAVARVEAGDGTGSSDPQLDRTSEGRGYVVFACMLDELDELRPDGRPLATTPRDLVDAPQTRDGVTLRFAVPGGTVKIHMPAESGTPTVNGSEVMSFPDAAVGSRRAAAARVSLEWLNDMEMNAQYIGQPEVAEQLRACYPVLLAQIYENPGCIDKPSDVLPGFEDYLLQDHPDLLPAGTDVTHHIQYERYNLERYMKRHNIIDPDERAALYTAIMPDVPIIESPKEWEMDAEAYEKARREYLDSYYKEGKDLGRGREGVLDRAVRAVRMARLQAAGAVQ